MEGSELLELSRKGDIQSFSELFRKYQSDLKGYLYRLLTNRDDVEDLHHDVFIKSFESIGSFRGDLKHLKNWIYRIATNMALNELKKRKRWEINAQDECRDSLVNDPPAQREFSAKCQAATYNQYDIREHIDFCFTCIAQILPIEKQVVLMLKDVLGFKVAEIEFITGFSQGRIKHFARDIRKDMNAIFKERCSLINKDGTCYQCTELLGLFNPRQNAQRELMKIELARNEGNEDYNQLYQLRSEIVQTINPIESKGRDLHDNLMQHLKKVNNLNHKP